MLKNYYNLLLSLCLLSNFNFLIQGEMGRLAFYTDMFLYFCFRYILEVFIVVVRFSLDVLIAVRSHKNNIRNSIFLC